MEYSNYLSVKHVNNKSHITVTRKHMRAGTDVHFHEFFEIELILSGGGSLMLNGQYYPMQRGSVVLMTPADFHQLLTGSEFSVLTFMFDGTLLSADMAQRLMAKRQNLSFSLPERQTEYIDTLARIIEDEVNDYGELSAPIIRGALECVLSLLLKHKEKDGSEPDSEWEMPIDKALRFLYIHFRDSPSLDEMAKLSGYSPAHFSRLFAKRTGKGFTAFLCELKVNLAKMLLSSTSRTASDIAFFCGFNSLSNFYRAFAGEVGCSPLEYRERSERKQGDCLVSSETKPSE